jgi:hypothetical protein
MNLKLKNCQLGNPWDTRGAILTECVILKTWESYGTKMSYIATSLDGVLYLGLAQLLKVSTDFSKCKIYCTDCRPQIYLRSTWGDEAGDLFENFLESKPEMVQYLKNLKPKKVLKK